MFERNPLTNRRAPRMSRAHFQLIADVLRDAVDIDDAVDTFGHGRPAAGRFQSRQ